MSAGSHPPFWRLQLSSSNTSQHSSHCIGKVGTVSLTQVPPMPATIWQCYNNQYVKNVDWETLSCHMLKSHLSNVRVLLAVNMAWTTALCIAVWSISFSWWSQTHLRTHYSEISRGFCSCHCDALVLSFSVSWVTPPWYTMADQMLKIALLVSCSNAVHDMSCCHAACHRCMSILFTSEADWLTLGVCLVSCHVGFSCPGPGCVLRQRVTQCKGDVGGLQP